MMRVSWATVYRLLHAGHLPSIRVGRSLRIPRQAVETYVRASGLPYAIFRLFNVYGPGQALSTLILLE